MFILYQYLNMFQFWSIPSVWSSLWAKHHKQIDSLVLQYLQPGKGIGMKMIIVVVFCFIFLCCCCWWWCPPSPPLWLIESVFWFNTKSLSIQNMVSTLPLTLNHSLLTLLQVQREFFLTPFSNLAMSFS